MTQAIMGTLLIGLIGLIGVIVYDILAGNHLKRGRSTNPLRPCESPGDRIVPATISGRATEI